MADQPIAGVSIELTDEDRERRAIVVALLKAENPTIIDFAKHLVTVSFTAVGVVVAFADKWVGPGANEGAKRLLLAVAIVMMLSAAALAAYAASASTYRVTLSDYDDVDAELHRVAKRRYTLTRAAMLLLVGAVMLLSGVALWSSS
jgi:hypothetical protein